MHLFDPFGELTIDCREEGAVLLGKDENEKGELGGSPLRVFGWVRGYLKTS